MSVALITAPGTINLAKNPVYAKFRSSAHTGLDNYRVVLRVQFEKSYESGTYTTIAETEAVPDSSGNTTFNVQDILQKAMELNMTFQVPDIETPVPYISDTLRRFKIQYTEKYGTPQVEQTPTTTSAYNVHYGGVDAHYFGLYDIFDNLDDSNAFLGYAPSGKFIARQQPEYLTYFNHVSSANVQHAFLKIVQYTNTGTTISTTDVYRLSDSYTDPAYPDRYQATVFPTDTDSLSIASNCVKYTVQVRTISVNSIPGGFEETGSASDASQTYTYYLDDNIQTISHDIIWFGSFNNPNILRCTGVKRNTLTIDRVMSEQVVAFGYDPTTMASVQHTREFNTPMTYRSGELTPEQKDALQELLIENKLLVHEADGNYYRLRLTQNSFNVYDQNNSPNYLEFTAVRSLAPRNYMRLRSIADGAPTEQQWLANDNGYWALNTGGGHWQLN